MVLGTAVRREGARSEQPVMTELSVADYALLLRARDRAGRDRRLELGVLRELRLSRDARRRAGHDGSMQPMSCSEFTQALYSARERTMGQITAQAAALGASGVVGVRIGHTIQPHTLSAAWAARRYSARASCAG